MARHIGFYVRQARERLGMTQLELANQLGYKTRSAIARIENGDNDIPMSKVKDFARVLNVTHGYLLGDEDINEAVDSMSAVDILKDAFKRTGYYSKEFTDDEIISIMKYAQFKLTERDN